MPAFKIKNEEIWIDFDFVFPDDQVQKKMKQIHYTWDPDSRLWHAPNNDDTYSLAIELCEIESVRNKRCCYANSVNGFLNETEETWINEMVLSFSEQYVYSLENAQITAWQDCFRSLQSVLYLLREKLQSFHIIFEYALPYEAGRRPDVILVNSKQVFVLEYKMKNDVLDADVDQTTNYASDLKDYHVSTREKEVIPVLVLTRMTGYKEYRDELCIVSDDQLISLLLNRIDQTGDRCDPIAWMNSKYEPLPSLVESAQMIMSQSELGNLERLENYPDLVETLEFIKDEVWYAKTGKKHYLVLLTGVPGSGKTTLGLRSVYDISNSENPVNSIYLSGNGGLVRVLQDALKSKVFINNIQKIVTEYSSGKMDDNFRNVIVFDEGQRAWNREKMQSSRKISKSEPELLIELCSKKTDWCTLVVMIGEGQEIYSGETIGFDEWEDALNQSDVEWEVISPTELLIYFPNHSVYCSDLLDLTESVRAYRAMGESDFVNYLMDGDIEKASAAFNEIGNYKCYLTRDLERAKKYCRVVYKNRKRSSFGMIASSKNRNLKKYGMDCSFGQTPDIAKWFNSPADDPQSCCALNSTLSEFGCQGLELDMPIMGWGDDCIWDGRSWKLNEALNLNPEEKEHRINSYRVLLTRGRDGIIIFIPEDKTLNKTYQLFKSIGVKELR